MRKQSLVLLVVSILLIGLFLVSALVFKNIKVSDWCSLAGGVLFLVAFAFSLKSRSSASPRVNQLTCRAGVCDAGLFLLEKGPARRKAGRVGDCMEWMGWSAYLAACLGSAVSSST